MFFHIIPIHIHSRSFALQRLAVVKESSAATIAGWGVPNTVQFRRERKRQINAPKPLGMSGTQKSKLYETTQIKFTPTVDLWAVLRFTQTESICLINHSSFTKQIIPSVQNKNYYYGLHLYYNVLFDATAMDCSLQQCLSVIIKTRILSSLVHGSSYGAAKSIQNVNHCRLRWFQWLAHRLSPNFPRPPFYLSWKHKPHNKSISISAT